MFLYLFKKPIFILYLSHLLQLQVMSEWVALCPTRHMTGHFRDESFQVITCTGNDNTKQTGENTLKHNTNKLALSN